MANLLGRPPYAVDALYRADSATAFKGETKNIAWNTRRNALLLQPSLGNYAEERAETMLSGKFTSAPIAADFPFHEIVPSWNIRLDEKAQGYRIYIRVANEKLTWSPWFYFGSGGTLALSPPKRKTITSPRWGSVNIDYLQLVRPATHFQYRVELESTREACALPHTRAALERFFVAYSNTAEDESLFQQHGDTTNGAVKPGKALIRTPYRSQLDVSEKKLRAIICCPTCVSMVLQDAGINKPTLEVAQEAYDPEHKIYGVWPRASQTAANNGLESWIQRFRTHAQARQMLAAGQTIMASIRVPQGQLRNARYKKIKWAPHPAYRLPTQRRLHRKRSILRRT